jgi:hypothetical protein
MVAAVLHNQVRVLVGNSSLTWLEEVGRGGSEAATASTASGGWCNIPPGLIGLIAYLYY